METEKIIQTLTDVFEGADERNWQKVLDAMAATVLLDYSSLTGNPAALLPSSEIVETWKGFLPGFDKTHHQVFNFKVSENGNVAMVTFDGKADHFIDNQVWTVEGAYDAEVMQLTSKWVVSKLKFNFSEQSGNSNLPALAIERLNNLK